MYLPPPENYYRVDEGLAAEKTAKNYRYTFKQFIQYADITPEQLLREDKRLIEDRIIGYIRFQDQVKHYTRGTIDISVCAIFHFLEMNDILLNKSKVKRFMPEDEREDDDRAYTHQEIQQILANCDERSRVIILLMASTGMRVGALHTLKIGHLTEIPEYKIYKINVYSNSKKHRYYTFCTPECATAINSYLDYRKRFGEILKDQAPLIREQFDISDSLAAKHPKELAHHSIIYIIYRLLKKTGLQIKGEVMRSHGFRKFTITHMIKAKMSYEIREYLVNHRHSRGLDINYDRTSEEDRLAEYLKAIQFLTISEEERLRSKMLKIQDEYQDIKNDINKIKTSLGLPPTG